MKKWLSLVLAVMMLFVGFAGCNKGEGDVEPSATPIENPNASPALEATVATVNGAIIKRGEVEELLYSQLGYYISLLDDATLQSYRETILDILIQQEVARQKAKELGYDQLTEEDLAKIEESYQDFYEGGIEYFTGVLQDEDAENGIFDEVIEATDYSERAEERLIDYLKENTYYTIEKFEGSTILEKYKNYVKDSYIISNKLLPGVTADVTVAEEDVKAEYDDLLEEQKTAYDEDITQYEQAVSSNMEYQYYYGTDAVSIVYVPEGYRYVKHILIMFEEETGAVVSEKQKALSTAEYALDYAEYALEEAQAAVEEAADDAEKESAETELATAQSEYDTAKEAYDTAKQEYDEALAAASAAIAEKVEEVYAKVEAGEDFEELIETYGEDPGMQNDMYKEKGYLLSAQTTTYYDVFTQAGMALEEVGDYSEPVYSSAGAHIIQFASIVEAGAIPYEEVRETIEKTLLEAAQNTEFSNLLAKWQSSGDFTIIQYADALNATIEEETEG